MKVVYLTTKTIQIKPRGKNMRFPTQKEQWNKKFNNFWKAKLFKSVWSIYPLCCFECLEAKSEIAWNYVKHMLFALNNGNARGINLQKASVKHFITWKVKNKERHHRNQFIIRPKKKKIGVFTVCRPTLFYSCRPYHFFSKNKKKRDCCPTLLERSRILVLVFKIFTDSILFSM